VHDFTGIFIFQLNTAVVFDLWNAFAKVFGIYVKSLNLKCIFSTI